MYSKRHPHIPQYLLILTTIFVLCFQSNAFLKKVYIDLNGFVMSKFNYLNVHRFRRASFTGLKTKSLLSSDAQVEVSGHPISIFHVALRYQLYPLPIVEEGTHFLDWDQRIETIPVGWTKKELPTGRNLYAKEGHGFRDPPNPMLNFPFWGSLLFSFFLAGFNIYIGWILLSVLSIKIEIGSKLWLLATSYLLGFLFLTATLWILMLCGGGLTRFSLVGLWSMLAVILTIIAQKKKYFSKFTLEVKDSNVEHKDRWIAKFLKLTVFLLMASIFFTSIVTPVNDWDGMSHWILKSKVLFNEQSLNFDYTHSNYYPILWPLNIAAQFTLLGGMYDEVAQWTSALLFLCLIIQFVKCLEFLSIPKTAKYFVVIFFLLAFFKNPHNPNLIENFINTNAENLFLSYLMAIIAWTVYWLNNQSKEPYLALGFILAIGLALTKIEGAVTGIFLGAALFYSGYWERVTLRIQKIIGALFLIALLPAAWIGWVWKQGYFTSAYHMRNPISFSKITLICEVIFANLLNSNMLYLSLLVAFFIIFYSKYYAYDSVEHFLLALSLLLLGFCFFATFGWAPDKIRLDLPDVTARLFLHAALPLSLLLASRAFARKSNCEGL